jgi:uncharacterized protein (DUF2147 family)
MSVSRLAALSVSALLLSSASAFAAIPIAGVWQTPEDGGQVEIYECGAQVCARAHASTNLKPGEDSKDVHNKNPALRSRSLKGVQVMQDFSGGPKLWQGGSMYRPADGGTYKGRLELIAPDKLKVTGCLVAMLCQSQTWKRLP